MATIPDTTIEEIKSRIDLGDLVASYGIQVRHAGSRMLACCPFHSEKTPSFSIDVGRGLYHCFGCGESGDAIKFVMKQDGLPFMDAVKKLASQCGVEIKEDAPDPGAGRRKRLYSLMAEVAQFYHRCLQKMKEAQLARDYLAKRALDEKTQDDFLIGYAPAGTANMLKWAEKYGYTPQELDAAGIVKLGSRAKGQGSRDGDGESQSKLDPLPLTLDPMSCYHRFAGRLMFTIRDRMGRVVAFSGRQLIENKHSGKYVNSPDTEIFKKSNVLFGLDRAAGNITKSAHREAIICEGQIDCIRLHISGFPVAVAGQGTAFTEEHVKMLARVADAALLVYDDDAAGHKATIRSAGLLLAAGIAVRVVRLPDGDDPDSFLRTKGAEAFQKLCDDAESIVHFQVGVERAKEQNPDSVDAVARVTKAVLTTISQCPNAVLKAGMAGEAAKLLNLPTIAINEELGKIKLGPRVEGQGSRAKGQGSRDKGQGPRAKGQGDGEYASSLDPRPSTLDPAPSSLDPWPLTLDPTPGVDAGAIIPPPPCERDFMAFLMANEGDAELAAMLGEFLPEDVFTHAFTRKFVNEWRECAAKGEELSADFAEGLAQQERKWLDDAMLGASISMASAMPKDGIMRDFICELWLRHVERTMGALSATPTDRAEIEWGCYLANCIPPLRKRNWSAATKIISEFNNKKGTN